MAISSCPECKNPISRHAPICPYCGISGEHLQQARERDDTASGCAALVVILGLLFAFLSNL